MVNHDHLLEKPVIFIGPGRSGSTIISEFVLIHESLGWPSNHLERLPHAPWVNLLRRPFDNRYWRMIGEKSQLNRTRHFNEAIPRPAEAYPFWEAITAPETDFARGFLLDRRADAAERTRVRRELGRMVAWQGKQRLGMKLTGPGRIGYLQSILPDARFINIVRDPVATVHSMLKVPFWRNLGMHRIWWTGAYSAAELAHFEQLRADPVAATAFQLAKVLETTQQEARACGARMLTLDYEAFVTDPRETVSQIMAFAALAPSRWVERKLGQARVHDRNRKARIDAADETTIRTLVPTMLQADRQGGFKRACRLLPRCQRGEVTAPRYRLDVARSGQPPATVWPDGGEPAAARSSPVRRPVPCARRWHARAWPAAVRCSRRSGRQAWRSRSHCD